MTSLKQFEREVIEYLTADVLPAPAFSNVLEHAEIVDYECTGCGYYLTLKHSNLPKNRVICSSPIVIGRSCKVEVGFVVFLGDNELVLECHSWGDDRIPETFRDQEVQVSVA